MISPYLLRLGCLSLAAFFLVHLALGLLVSICASWAIGRASRLDASRAARFLLILRLLPGAAAALAVAGICVPSYLWLEPEASAEQVGLACLIAAMLGLTILTISMARGLRASTRSLRYIRHCQRVGHRTNLSGEPAPVWVVRSSVERPAPLLALTGIVRPRLVISQSVVSALSAGQLAAALRHEHAHRASRDNLKRLAVLLSPGLFPCVGGFDELERAWVRFTEFAADDQAVEGDGRRSLFLAAALVRVARLGKMAAAPATAPPLATSLLTGGQDLSARVHRLLHPAPARPKQESPFPVTGAVFALAATLAIMLQPAVLRGAHRLLEHLIR